MRYLFFLIASGILASCGVQKNVVDSEAAGIQISEESQDSLEYEIVVIDPGFESWFVKNRKPKWYYEQSYLETWNLRYVREWNFRVTSVRFQQAYPNNPFDEQIDYNPRNDYGLEVNWKLYHYFKYIEETWGKILL